MAIEVRSGSGAVQAALVSQHNALLKKIAETLTTEPHADVTSTTSGDFSAPAATARTVATTAPADLAAVITRANQLLVLLQDHMADDLAHKAVDGTNGGGDGDTLDVAELASTATQGATDTRLNLLQSAYNAHLTQSGVHYTNDTTNPNGTTVSSSLATSKTLAAELATSANAHVSFALGASAIKLIGA